MNEARVRPQRNNVARNNETATVPPNEITQAFLNFECVRKNCRCKIVVFLLSRDKLLRIVPLFPRMASNGRSKVNKIFTS